MRRVIQGKLKGYRLVAYVMDMLPRNSIISKSDTQGRCGPLA